jgi:nitroreductase
MENMDPKILNDTLDFLIKTRRSTRKFKNGLPPLEIINEVVTAGLYAPYAGLTGMHLGEIRRFIVFPGSSPMMDVFRETLYTTIRARIKPLNIMGKIVPKLRKKGHNFIKRLNSMAKSGIPALDNAPYIIIVAEKKGVPESEDKSIAHVMQNMWLKATALGLGFQLLSATNLLSKNIEFVQKIGLPPGEFEIDGCIIGYPDQDSAAPKNLKLEEFTTWL